MNITDKNTFSKKLLIPSNFYERMHFSFLDNKKIILFEMPNDSYKYISIPSQVNFVIQNKMICFFIEKKNDYILLQFLKVLENFLKNLDKIFSKKIILKGLGMRIFLSHINDKILLKFKLGFSHLIEYMIPSNKFQLLLKKSSISIKSEDATFLGNLCSKIRNLKRVNVYNGKGLRYKNEKIILKIFKKK
jgi:ribosomal protein L6P/L9E